MSSERLREAAKVWRERDHEVYDAPISATVADWLTAEADHFDRMANKATALNFLIAGSDADGDMQTWRISLGYQTIEQALAVADAILGKDDQ